MFIKTLTAVFKPRLQSMSAMIMVNDCTTICDSLQICNIIDTGPFIEALRDTIKVYFYYRHTLF